MYNWNKIVGFIIALITFVQCYYFIFNTMSYSEPQEIGIMVMILFQFGVAAYLWSANSH